MVVTERSSGRTAPDGAGRFEVGEEGLPAFGVSRVG